MSAIWGMIDFKKTMDVRRIAERMERPYYDYKIDTFHKVIQDNLLFGYGGQFFTKEAKLEQQPIEDTPIIFASDVVLDNREELFDRLGFRSEERDSVPDGTLMYQVFRKFKKESLSMFLGTYSFACYDDMKKEITLVTDVLGSRSLYYCYEGGVLYFSTLIYPILMARKKMTWNYRFLTDFLALDGYALYTESVETPFQNIHKVSPGQMVTINSKELRKEEYWKPDIKSKRKIKNDDEIKEEFIRLFHTCVSGVMRSCGRTGILLSGGLDSTSVACFAAPHLKEQEELLYSYTSVPLDSYVQEIPSYYITNEKNKVEITKEFLGNLCCKFPELSDTDGFKDASDILKKYEIPYKALLNISWFNALSKAAAGDGCRIMLTGQYGNATISFGDFEMHFNSLFRQGRIMELVKEVNAYHRQYRFSRKRIYKEFLINDVLGALTRKRDKEELLNNIYANPKLLERYRVKQRFMKSDDNNSKGQTETFKKGKLNMAYKKALIQIGEFETRLSLDTGVLLRDPTKDKRIIEFCLQLPEKQYVYRGLGRRLVREYLKDYIPEEIRMDLLHKGKQSADMIYKLNKNWKNVYEECNNLLQTEAANKLLDLPKIKNKLAEFKDNISVKDEFEVMKILYSVLLVKYMLIFEEVLQSCKNN